MAALIGGRSDGARPSRTQARRPRLRQVAEQIAKPPEAMRRARHPERTQDRGHGPGLEAGVPVDEEFEVLVGNRVVVECLHLERLVGDGGRDHAFGRRARQGELVVADEDQAEREGGVAAIGVASRRRSPSAEGTAPGRIRHAGPRSGRRRPSRRAAVASWPRRSSTTGIPRVGALQWCRLARRGRPKDPLSASPVQWRSPPA
jgi:hypothetical protein